MLLSQIVDCAVMWNLSYHLAGLLPEGTTAEILVADPANRERLVIIGLVMLLMMAVGILIDSVFLGMLIVAPQKWAERMKRTLRPRIRLIDGVIFVMVLCFLHAIGAGVYVLVRMLRGGVDSELGGLLAQSVCMHWAVIVTAGVLLKVRGETLNSFFGVRFRKVLNDMLLGVAFFLGTLPVILVLTLLYRVVLVHFNVELDMQDILLQLTANHYPLIVKIYLLTLAVVLAPLAEEILFRGYCFRYIGKYWGGVAGVVLSSLIFAAIHLHVPSLVPIFVLACGLSVSYWMTGSLLVPITMHAVFNANSLLIMLLLR